METIRELRFVIAAVVITIAGSISLTSAPPFVRWASLGVVALAGLYFVVAGVRLRDHLTPHLQSKNPRANADLTSNLASDVQIHNPDRQ